jgi:hypothetical protein
LGLLTFRDGHDELERLLAFLTEPEELITRYIPTPVLLPVDTSGLRHLRMAGCYAAERGNINM